MVIVIGSSIKKSLSLVIILDFIAQLFYKKVQILFLIKSIFK